MLSYFLLVLYDRGVIEKAIEVWSGYGDTDVNGMQECCLPFSLTADAINVESSHF